jgi:hypothetical protein
MTRGPAQLAAALVLVAALRIAPAGLAGEIGDVLPFRIVHGRPPEGTAATLAILWSEGGRLKLRFHARSEPDLIEGELRMSRGGVFKDVRPLTENLRVRMPAPDTIRFDVAMDGMDEGFDVALSGDFSTLTVDLRVDGERRPTELAIGERAERPIALPAQLDLDDVSPAWVERFGFR